MLFLFRLPKVERVLLRLQERKDEKKLNEETQTGIVLNLAVEVVVAVLLKEALLDCQANRKSHMLQRRDRP